MRTPLPYSVSLKGIDGANPLGVLAALGLTKLLSSASPRGRFALAWEQATYSAQLWCDTETPIDDLAKIAADLIRSVFAGPLSPGSYPSASINIASKHFRRLLESQLDVAMDADPSPKLFVELAAGFGVPSPQADEPIARTQFSFANGQSGLNLFGGKKIEKSRKGGADKEKTYAGLRTIAAAPQLKHLLMDALITWKSTDDYPSFCWCPTEYRPGAFQSHASDMRNVPGANILALFGLSMFPVVPVRDAVVSVGFDRIDGHDHFVWPLWASPISESVIMSLLTSRWAGIRPDERLALGVFDVRASKRIVEGEVPRVRYYFGPSMSI